MSHLRTFTFALASSLAAACGGAETTDPADDLPDGAEVFAVAARDGKVIPEGEVIFNLHWYPRGGKADRLQLRIDGKIAVWGEAGTPPPGFEPEPGAPVVLVPETGVPSIANPPIGLAPGTYDIEYVLDGEVVVRLEAQTLETSQIYSLVAFGDPEAPSQLLFTDANPIVDPDAYPAGVTTLRVVNLATTGNAANAFTRTQMTFELSPLFSGLAYGAVWEGTAPVGSLYMFDDNDVATIPLGGFGVATNARYLRAFLYDKEPHTGNLIPVGDGYWGR